MGCTCGSATKSDCSPDLPALLSHDADLDYRYFDEFVDDDSLSTEVPSLVPADHILHDFDRWRDIEATEYATEEEDEEEEEEEEVDGGTEAPPPRIEKLEVEVKSKESTSTRREEASKLEKRKSAYQEQLEYQKKQREKRREVRREAEKKAMQPVEIADWVGAGMHAALADERQRMRQEAGLGQDDLFHKIGKCAMRPGGISDIDCQMDGEQYDITSEHRRIRITCSENCLVLLHFKCWQRLKKEKGLLNFKAQRAAKEVVVSFNCPTDGCEGHVLTATLENEDESGALVKQLEYEAPVELREPKKEGRRKDKKPEDSLKKRGGISEKAKKGAGAPGNFVKQEKQRVDEQESTPQTPAQSEAGPAEPDPEAILKALENAKLVEHIKTEEDTQLDTQKATQSRKQKVKSQKQNKKKSMHLMEFNSDAKFKNEGLVPEDDGSEDGRSVFWDGASGGNIAQDSRPAVWEGASGGNIAQDSRPAVWEGASGASIAQDGHPAVWGSQSQPKSNPNMDGDYEHEPEVASTQQKSPVGVQHVQLHLSNESISHALELLKGGKRDTWEGWTSVLVEGLHLSDGDSGLHALKAICNCDNATGCISFAGLSCCALQFASADEALAAVVSINEQAMEGQELHASALTMYPTNDVLEQVLGIESVPRPWKWTEVARLHPSPIQQAQPNPSRSQGEPSSTKAALAQDGANISPCITADNADNAAHICPVDAWLTAHVENTVRSQPDALKRGRELGSSVSSDALSSTPWESIQRADPLAWGIEDDAKSNNGQRHADGGAFGLRKPNRVSAALPPPPPPPPPPPTRRMLPSAPHSKPGRQQTAAPPKLGSELIWQPPPPPRPHNPPAHSPQDWTLAQNGSVIKKKVGLGKDKENGGVGGEHGSFSNRIPSLKMSNRQPHESVVYNIYNIHMNTTISGCNEPQPRVPEAEAGHQMGNPGVNLPTEKWREVIKEARVTAGMNREKEEALEWAKRVDGVYILPCKRQDLDKCSKGNGLLSVKKEMFRKTPVGETTALFFCVMDPIDDMSLTGAWKPILCSGDSLPWEWAIRGSPLHFHSNRELRKIYWPYDPKALKVLGQGGVCLKNPQAKQLMMLLLSKRNESVSDHHKGVELYSELLGGPENLPYSRDYGHTQGTERLSSVDQMGRERGAREQAFLPPGLTASHDPGRWPQVGGVPEVSKRVPEAVGAKTMADPLDRLFPFMRHPEPVSSTLPPSHPQVEPNFPQTAIAGLSVPPGFGYELKNQNPGQADTSAPGMDTHLEVNGQCRLGQDAPVSTTTSDNGHRNLGALRSSAPPGFGGKAPHHPLAAVFDVVAPQRYRNDTAAVEKDQEHSDGDPMDIDSPVKQDTGKYLPPHVRRKLRDY